MKRKAKEVREIVIQSIDKRHLFYVAKDLIEASGLPQKALFEYGNCLSVIKDTLTDFSDSWKEATDEQIFDLFRRELREYAHFVFDDIQKEDYFIRRILRHLEYLIDCNLVDCK